MEHGLLKFCPECGKELEQHPISFNQACFLHGEFITSIHDTGKRYEWIPTKNLIKRPEN